MLQISFPILVCMISTPAARPALQLQKSKETLRQPIEHDASQVVFEVRRCYAFRAPPHHMFARNQGIFPEIFIVWHKWFQSMALGMRWIEGCMITKIHYTRVEFSNIFWRKRRGDDINFYFQLLPIMKLGIGATVVK